MVELDSKNVCEYDLLRSKFGEYKQDHVFKFFDTLKPKRKQLLCEQLSLVPIEDLQSMFESAMKLSTCTELKKIAPLDENMIIKGTEADYARWNRLGLEAIRDGQVGVVTLAGGQGTRLGSSDPKGLFNIGLPSNKSLFQLQAERLIRLAKVANASKPISWYVMTSGPTHDRTVEFFQQHAYFGIDPAFVKFFSQGVLPALDMNGKIIMSEKDQIALAPNGNGGIYQALLETGTLEAMRKAGIKHVHLYCVDNCLVKPADPEFVGACIEKKTDCAAKSVLKVTPEEPVGVLCKSATTGKLMVVEYSEMEKSNAELRNAAGDLVYCQANIANHYFSMEFLQRFLMGDQRSAITTRLPLHVAHKKIPTIDMTSGEKAATPMAGIKLEAFIFDVFELATNPIIYQVSRAAEFAPLKNAVGANSDTAEHCRRQLLTLHQSWWERLGVKKALDQAEVSPLDSYFGEDLKFINYKES